jgi:mannose-6-phosphate isomerase-like protein (cupin superfamily)
VEQPEVLPIADAPNWAETRFGLAETELDLRILRGRLRCEHVGVSYVRFGAGWRLTLGHRHPPGGEEVYVLVEGRAEIKVGDQILSMAAPSAIRVPGEQFRAVRAVGDVPATFVVVGYPIEDPNETVFARDFWPEDEERR